MGTHFFGTNILLIKVYNPRTCVHLQVVVALVPIAIVLPFVRSVTELAEERFCVVVCLIGVGFELLRCVRLEGADRTIVVTGSPE